MRNKTIILAIAIICLVSISFSFWKSNKEPEIQTIAKIIGINLSEQYLDYCLGMSLLEAQRHCSKINCYSETFIDYESGMNDQQAIVKIDTILLATSKGVSFPYNACTEMTFYYLSGNNNRPVVISVYPEGYNRIFAFCNIPFLSGVVDIGSVPSGFNRFHVKYAFVSKEIANRIKFHGFRPRFIYENGVDSQLSKEMGNDSIIRDYRYDKVNRNYIGAAFFYPK